MQDVTNSQLKLRVNEAYKKDEKKTTNFEPTADLHVINKAYLDQKLKKRDGHNSYFEINYNDFILQYNKQSVEEVFAQTAVKTTTQILYDKGLFDDYANADKVLEDFFYNKT